MQSAARILASDNRAPLGRIAAMRPNSIAELATLSGREPSNLSWTLKTMHRLGLVSIEKIGTRPEGPRFPYDDIVLDIPVPVINAVPLGKRHAKA